MGSWRRTRGYGGGDAADVHHVMHVNQSSSRGSSWRIMDLIDRLNRGNNSTTEMSDFLFSAMYLLMGTMWSEVLKINCNKTDFSMGIAPNSLSEKFNIFGDMKKYFLGKTLKKFGFLMVCTC